MTFSGQGERFVNKPWGIFGGGPGSTGRFVKLSEGREVALPTKPANLEVSESEAIVVETPGAGGYGNPAERDRTEVEHDFVSGKFSREFIRGNYGVDPKA
jgi:N-methylhydantoinase B